MNAFIQTHKDGSLPRAIVMPLVVNKCMGWNLEIGHLRQNTNGLSRT